jgi:hypothetical protein
MPCLPIASLHPLFSFDIVYSSDLDGHRPYAEAAFGFGQDSASAAGANCVVSYSCLRGAMDNAAELKSSDLFLSFGHILGMFTTSALQETWEQMQVLDMESFQNGLHTIESSRLNGLASCALLQIA